jgi:hypothetical protein
MIGIYSDSSISGVIPITLQSLAFELIRHH